MQSLSFAVISCSWFIYLFSRFFVKPNTFTLLMFALSTATYIALLVKCTNPKTVKAVRQLYLKSLLLHNSIFYLGSLLISEKIWYGYIVIVIGGYFSLDLMVLGQAMSK